MQNKIRFPMYFSDLTLARAIWQKSCYVYHQISRRAHGTSGAFVSAAGIRSLVYFRKSLADISTLVKGLRQSTWILSGGEEINEDGPFADWKTLYQFELLSLQ
jgi:hypothetical protein